MKNYLDYRPADTCFLIRQVGNCTKIINFNTFTGKLVVENNKVNF